MRLRPFVLTPSATKWMDADGRLLTRANLLGAPLPPFFQPAYSKETLFSSRFCGSGSTYRRGVLHVTVTSFGVL